MEPARTLVASYCFPPYSDTAGIVAAKRVWQRNEPVDVIANAMDTKRERDYSLAQIGGDLVQRYAALKTPTAFAAWSSIETWTNAGYRTFLRWQDAQGPYERIYSRAQFAASHFLAAHLKLQSPGMQWLAEFSDPLSHDVLGASRGSALTRGALSASLQEGVADAGYRVPHNNNLLEWCEIITFALADQFMFTNETQMNFMIDHCGDDRLADRVRERAIVSPHPTLPREFYSMVRTDYELPKNRVNIGYFGNFYANRGVGLVLDALKLSPSWVRDRVLFHVFTSRPAELNELVIEKEVEKSVQVGPYRGYLEFLNLADQMDVLLINDAVTPEGGVNPFLPSKWSDYKGSVAPTWGIIEEGSTLDKEPKIAYRTPVEHITAIQGTLARIIADTDSRRKNPPRHATAEPSSEVA